MLSKHRHFEAKNTCKIHQNPQQEVGKLCKTKGRNPMKSIDKPFFAQKKTQER